MTISHDYDLYNKHLVSAVQSNHNKDWLLKNILIKFDLSCLHDYLDKIQKPDEITSFMTAE